MWASGDRIALMLPTSVEFFAFPQALILKPAAPTAAR
jgi:hypothetical protein